jgi:hypothetical protein
MKLYHPEHKTTGKALQGLVIRELGLVVEPSPIADGVYPVVETGDADLVKKLKEKGFIEVQEAKKAVTPPKVEAKTDSK